MIGENLNFGGTAFQMKNKANKKLSQEVPTFQNKIELQSFNPLTLGGIPVTIKHGYCKHKHLTDCLSWLPNSHCNCDRPKKVHKSATIRATNGRGVCGN